MILVTMTATTIDLVFFMYILGARAARSYQDEEGSAFDDMTEEEQKEMFKNLGKHLKQTKVSP